MTRLDAAGFADTAATDREQANAVAAHKSIFFAKASLDGTPIDYGAAVNGALVLVPTGDAGTALAGDYQRMIDDGLLLDDAEPFDSLLASRQVLAEGVNAISRP